MSPQQRKRSCGWRELHRLHALALNPSMDEIRMANPFSPAPTAYQVHAAGRSWNANCTWDGGLRHLHLHRHCQGWAGRCRCQGTNGVWAGRFVASQAAGRIGRARRTGLCPWM